MLRIATSALVAALLLIAGPAFAQLRLPVIPPDQYDAEQKKAAEEFLAACKVPVFGPFEPMMYSPQVMTNARATGDYLRYHAAIGNALSELVILIAAREWSQSMRRLRSRPASPRTSSMRLPPAAARRR
jgi:4-carboxymuconolactone decarboxylase